MPCMDGNGYMILWACWRTRTPTEPGPLRSPRYLLYSYDCSMLFDGFIMIYLFLRQFVLIVTSSKFVDSSVRFFGFMHFYVFFFAFRIPFLVSSLFCVCVVGSPYMSSKPAHTHTHTKHTTLSKDMTDLVIMVCEFCLTNVLYIYIYTDMNVAKIISIKTLSSQKRGFTLIISAILWHISSCMGG